ncbi:hypothetical protein EDM60_19000 [Brevibacillus parabrevis]|nr:hypothetical protein EDM60_19000 [Brevibacillus parabrevis]
MTRNGMEYNFSIVRASNDIVESVNKARSPFKLNGKSQAIFIGISKIIGKGNSLMGSGRRDSEIRYSRAYNNRGLIAILDFFPAVLEGFRSSLHRAGDFHRTRRSING